jgi:hypothetical protein
MQREALPVRAGAALIAAGLWQHRCGRGVIQVRHLIRYPDTPRERRST